MSSRYPGARTPTNRVYSSNAHGETFKVLPPSRHLKWPTNTTTSVHPKGRLRTRQMTKAERKRLA